ncbi:MAG: hypothetical protein H8E55_04115 [Pelagibacterales bacterium]|nr:hypothetical protein [Pelagibacterales bacterium]
MFVSPKKNFKALINDLKNTSIWIAPIVIFSRFMMLFLAIIYYGFMLSMMFVLPIYILYWVLGFFFEFHYYLDEYTWFQYYSLLIFLFATILGICTDSDKAL